MIRLKFVGANLKSKATYYNRIKYISSMKGVILLALLLTFSLQQTVLLSSNPSNTIVTDPAGYSVVQEAYHTSKNPNYIGYDAQWIYKNGSKGWPDGDTATFYTTFYADCQSLAVLVITSDNSFCASLNGGAAMTGNNWFKIYKFNMTDLKCGVNTLTIKVVNQHAGSPAALIFAVVQDQTKCYGCDSPASFYNYNTCKCQCYDQCNCSPNHPSYVWYDYPICGCKCKTVVQCAADHYFNHDTCACQCKPIACLPGYVQDPTTCLCKKKCAKTPKCYGNYIWSQESCKCLCMTVKCKHPLVWSTKYCRCQKYYD